MRKLRNISKEFTFDCAHMLSGHEGLCSNLHGHTYKLIVTVEAPLEETEDITPGNFMIVDYKILKQLVQEYIIDVFDHAMIFSEEYLRGPVEESIFNMIKNNCKYVEVPDRSTAESMSEYMACTLFNAFTEYGLGIDRLKIQLYETPTSCAEFILG